MGFLRRDRRTLNEQLLDNLDDASDVRSAHADDAPEPQPTQEDTAAGPFHYWDVVVDAVAGGLSEDSYEFASLAGGDLVVEENVEESLSALADAVNVELEPPYRAVAIRQRPEWWSISARRIEVAPLDVEGERVRLVSAGGDLELEVDGHKVENFALLAALAERALGLGDNYVVEGTYLDGGLWELRALSTSGG